MCVWDKESEFVFVCQTFCVCMKRVFEWERVCAKERERKREREGGLKQIKKEASSYRIWPDLRPHLGCFFPVLKVYLSFCPRIWEEKKIKNWKAFLCLYLLHQIKFHHKLPQNDNKNELGTQTSNFIESIKTVLINSRHFEVECFFIRCKRID